MSPAPPFFFAGWAGPCGGRCCENDAGGGPPAAGPIAPGPMPGGGWLGAPAGGPIFIGPGMLGGGPLGDLPKPAPGFGVTAPKPPGWLPGCANEGGGDEGMLGGGCEGGLTCACAPVGGKAFLPPPLRSAKPCAVLALSGGGGSWMFEPSIIVPPPAAAMLAPQR